MEKKYLLLKKRHQAIRHRVKGTSERPRLSVYRGLRHLYVQVIDDTQGKTLIGYSDKTILPKGSGNDRAQALAKAIAQKIKAQKISTVTLDRGGFRYHGQIRTLADTLRNEGIVI